MIRIIVETALGKVTFNSMESFIEYLKMLDESFTEYSITISVAKTK